MSNARVFVALSAIDGMMVVTNPVERSVVSISQDASAAIPPVPSFFSDIPTPTPIAKRIAMLSIRAPPALTRNRPIRLAVLPPEALTLFPVFEEISYISPPLK